VDGHCVCGDPSGDFVMAIVPRPYRPQHVVTGRGEWWAEPPPLAGPSFAPSASVRPPRARWVWDPSPMLHDARERSEFLDFCERFLPPAGGGSPM